MPWPPVERITPVRSCRISALVASMVALFTHWIMSGGAPASSAAWYNGRGLARALVRARMRADDDGVAGFQRNQDLVNCRGGRIGSGQNSRHHAYRHGDFDQLLLRQFADDPDGLHAPHAARQPVR